MEYKVKQNLLQIQAEIAPYKLNIIAVTKYFDEKAIIEAYEAGLRNFAESRIPESIEKISKLPEYIRENSHFHYIGHLQTNKVKKVVENFEVIQSVDSLGLAQKISDIAKEKCKIQKIMLQVNNADEPQKFGFSKSEIFENYAKISKLNNINIIGIMNIAPLNISEDKLYELFSDVVEIKKEIESQNNCKLQEVSMGMSQDYKIAAKAGSTMLRIGRKLFN